ncbi:hypothetical protein OAL64_01350 [bacterium]|nr:hypothetical protein [Rubripirellula sp.]MDC0326273.1 hypothetical protein [bacterium]
MGEAQREGEVTKNAGVLFPKAPAIVIDLDRSSALHANEEAICRLFKPELLAAIITRAALACGWLAAE